MSYVGQKKGNYAEMEEEHEEEISLMALEESKEGKKNEWFLESGCRNHMSGNKRWFSELYENFIGKVKLGNDTHIIVIGKGSIQMKVNGLTHIVKHVYYVLELKNNILSIGQLQEKGLSIKIQNHTCTITHPEKGVICKVQMNARRMFMLTAAMGTDICL